MKRTFQMALVYFSLLLLLIFINLEISTPILRAVKTIIVILTIVIPGYLFVLLFLDKTGNSEVFVTSIAMSICFVILTGILIHFLGFPINAYIVLNILWFIILFFITILFLKRKSIKIKKEIRVDKIFFLNLVLILLFLLILVYLSINLKSSEEFVELNWEFVKVENSWNKSDAICQNITCSLSGINKLKRTKIDQVEYNILFLDLNQPENYDSICIDLNQNNIYCEDEEGPFWAPEGFMINNNTFSYNIFDDDIVIFSFPRKLVNRTDFNVSYNIKSHYSEILYFDVILNVNEKIFSQKEIILEPGEQTSIKDYVSIPEEEKLHKVEVIVSPKGTNQSAKINFFVKYSTEF